MKTTITIDETLCSKCKVCADICPNGIFRTENGITSADPVRSTLCIMCGQCMAACPEKAIHIEGLDYDKDFFDLPVADGSFDSLIRSRRSVRAFRDMPVPEAILEEIVNAVTFAPPSFPPIKTEITVIRDEKLIREALPHMISLYDKLLKGLRNPVARYFIRRETGRERMNVIMNHIVPMFSIKLPFMKEGLEDAITRNARAMILFHADRNADNHTSDIYIALACALLKAHELGIGATAIDLIPPAIERMPVLREMFRIPEDNTVVASVILGYPAYRYRRAIKRQLKSITWI